MILSPPLDLGPPTTLRPFKCMLSFEDRTYFPTNAAISPDDIPRPYRVFECHVLSNIPNTNRSFDLSQRRHHRTQRLAHTTSDISPTKPSIVCLSPLTTSSPLHTPQHLPDPVETASLNIRYATTSTSSFMLMPSPLTISRQPAHAFSPARPLRAQRKVAGGGGDVVFLLGPNLTDLAPAPLLRLRMLRTLRRGLVRTMRQRPWRPRTRFASLNGDG